MAHFSTNHFLFFGEVKVHDDLLSAAAGSALLLVIDAA
jgi:hypothetical protein